MRLFRAGSARKTQRLRRPTLRWVGQQSRKGSILVLATGCVVIVLAFTAFAVDIGYISMTKAQLQNATDAAALAGASDLSSGLGWNYTAAAAAETKARASAVSVAGYNKAAGNESVFVNSSRDVRFGNRSWNTSSNTWVNSWGSQPYNIIEVTAHRDQSGSAGDRMLPLFFAPVIGSNNASLATKSVAGLTGVGGFYLAANSSGFAGILPITYDKPSWDGLMANGGSDNYSYNTTTGAITSGSDGIPEFDLYPYGNQDLTPGNRGTVTIGPPNNSTNTLRRQIEEGLNANDLSYYPNNTLSVDPGPLFLKGNPGLSAGIKDSLEAIKGQPRSIPIFTSVTGQGNNTTYTIVKFVGIRILFVRLTGGDKKVVVQPAPYVEPSGVSSTSSGTSSYIFTTARILQ